MSKRRTHSTIDRLPADLRARITAMLIDNEWPSDFVASDSATTGNPRYADIAAYIRQHGHRVSDSAVGRWGAGLRALSMLAAKRDVVTKAMQGVNSDNASESQKAIAELLSARLLDLIVSDDTLSPKQIADLAKSTKDMAYVAITADKYIRSRTEEKAKAADQAVIAIAAKKQIDPETLRAIREQIYGIVTQ